MGENKTDKLMERNDSRASEWSEESEWVGGKELIKHLQAERMDKHSHDVHTHVDRWNTLDLHTHLSGSYLVDPN